MTPKPLPATASPGLLYQHEIVLVGREWYANVQVGPWESHTRVEDLLAILSVKHGWPVSRIIVYGADPELLCVAGGTAQRLDRLYNDIKQNRTPPREDVLAIMSGTMACLFGNEPLTLSGGPRL